VWNEVVTTMKIKKKYIYIVLKKLKGAYSTIMMQNYDTTILHVGAI